MSAWGKCSALTAYHTWALADKLKLLDLMEEYGVTVDTGVAALARDKNRGEQEREAALDAFMAAKYGVNGRIDTVSLESILIAEKGEINAWSPEEKAWYTDFQRELGLLSPEEERLYSLPGDNELTQREAEALARAYLRGQPACGQEAESAEAIVFSLVHASGETENTWEITFRFSDGQTVRVDLPAARGTTAEQVTPCLHILPEDDDGTLAETLDARRAALEEKYGPENAWTLEALHEWMPETYLLPEAGEIAPAEAERLARAALAEAFPQDAEMIAANPGRLTLCESQAGGVPERDYIFELYPSDGATLFTHSVYLSAADGTVRAARRSE